MKKIAVKMVLQVLGYVACMCSSAFFLSPSPTFNTIVRNQSVQEFDVAPYLAAVLNCAFMIMNGFVNNNMLVMTVFALGFIMELAYIAIFIYYANHNARKKILYWLCGGCVFFATYSLVFQLALHHPSQKKIAFGVISAVFNIAMHSFPLVIMGRVMDTESVNCMPFWLTMATFPHAFVWMVYGIIKNDYYHAVGNLVGVLLGIFQMVLYGYYCNRHPAIPEAAPGLPAIPVAAPAILEAAPTQPAIPGAAPAILEAAPTQPAIPVAAPAILEAAPTQPAIPGAAPAILEAAPTQPAIPVAAPAILEAAPTQPAIPVAAPVLPQP